MGGVYGDLCGTWITNLILSYARRLTGAGLERQLVIGST